MQKGRDSGFGVPAIFCEAEAVSDDVLADVSVFGETSGDD